MSRPVSIVPAATPIMLTPAVREGDACFFSGAPARTPWFSSQTIPIGELFTISMSPSPSKSMGCIDDAPWASTTVPAGSSAAASATMLLRLILEHSATRGHGVSFAAVLA